MRQFLSAILFPLVTLSAVVLPISGAFLFSRNNTITQVSEATVPTFTQIEITISAEQSEVEKEFLEIPDELASYVKNIQKNSSDILEIELTTDQIALVSSNHESQPIELKRLLAILQGFEFETIEEKIVEIDVRYKLPVLRTTKSTEQIRSEFSQSSESKNKEETESAIQTNTTDAQESNEAAIATQAAVVKQE